MNRSELPINSLTFRPSERRQRAGTHRSRRCSEGSFSTGCHFITPPTRGGDQRAAHTQFRVILTSARTTSPDFAVRAGLFRISSVKSGVSARIGAAEPPALRRAAPLTAAVSRESWGRDAVTQPGTTHFQRDKPSPSTSSFVIFALSVLFFILLATSSPFTFESPRASEFFSLAGQTGGCRCWPRVEREHNKNLILR